MLWRLVLGAAAYALLSALQWSLTMCGMAAYVAATFTTPKKKVPQPVQQLPGVDLAAPTVPPSLGPEVVDRVYHASKVRKTPQESHTLHHLHFGCLSTHDCTGTSMNACVRSACGLGL
jgi:hypothetical protein